jgi:phage terminase large subunit-like protein
LGASNAIAVSDPAGSRKLDKAKSTQRIDMIVAAVMALHSVTEGEKASLPDDLGFLIA